MVAVTVWVCGLTTSRVEFPDARMKDIDPSRLIVVSVGVGPVAIVAAPTETEVVARREPRRSRALSPSVSGEREREGRDVLFFSFVCFFFIVPSPTSWPR